jgi:hypothetical protein
LNTRSKHVVPAPRKRGHGGNRNHPPSPNEWFWKICPIPCIALYKDVSIDILKGNSFYICV